MFKYKKTTFIAVFFATFFTQGFSDNQYVCCASPSYIYDMLPVLEIKGGYFIFSDAILRKVYDEGGLDVQLSASYPIWRCIQLYCSLEYLERHGKSLGAGEKTKIWEVPVSLGLKPVFSICNNIEYYVALGPRYFFVRAHTDSETLDPDLQSNGLGGFINTGFNFFPYRRLLVDIFVEYSYKKLAFHASRPNVQGRTIQVGGLALGLGLSLPF